MSNLPTTTWRLVKERPGASYEYKEVPLAPPQGDELLVRVDKVALCGTDIQLYQWNKGDLLVQRQTRLHVTDTVTGLEAICYVLKHSLSGMAHQNINLLTTHTIQYSCTVIWSQHVSIFSC